MECNISIRDFQVNDVPRKVEWINNPENNSYLHYDIPLDCEKTLAWFHNRNTAVRRDCVIEYCGHPVGLVGLLNIDHASRKAELYISMGETRFKRRGIGYGAIKLLLNYAFHDLGLNKIYLNVDVENTAACKLYEKVGFSCEGYFRQDLLHRGRLIDRKRYAILRDDYFEHSDTQCRNPE